MVSSFAVPSEVPPRRPTETGISLRSSRLAQGVVRKGCGVTASQVFDVLPWSPDRDPYLFNRTARILAGLPQSVSNPVVQVSEGPREELARKVAESLLRPLQEPGEAVLETVFDEGAQCFLEWLAGKAIDALLVARGVPPLRKITLLLRGGSILETLLERGPESLADCAASKDLAESATGAGLHHLVNEALLIQGPGRGPQGQPAVYQLRYYALEEGHFQERGSKQVVSSTQRDASKFRDAAYPASVSRRPGEVELVTSPHGNDRQPAILIHGPARQSEVVLIVTRKTVSDSTAALSEPHITHSNRSSSLPVVVTAGSSAFAAGAFPQGSKRPKKRGPRPKYVVSVQAEDRNKLIK